MSLYISNYMKMTASCKWRRATRNAQLFPTLNLSPIPYRAHLDVRASLFTFDTDTVWVQGSAVTGWGKRHDVEQTIY